MSEWWSYTLADFLLFAPRTYHRLFELYNATLWPAHVPTLAAGVAIAVLLHRGGARSGRIVVTLLVLSWAWVAWGFHWQRYATINWAATWMAAAFALQALLLLGAGIGGHTFLARGRGPCPGRIAVALAVTAVAGYPLLGVFSDRGIASAEVFGLAPDPTVLATLGALALLPNRARALLLPIPLAWCAVSGATLWAMAAPHWWLLPVAALVTAATILVATEGR